MYHPTRFEFTNGWLLLALLFALIASGCSLEKRTLMSGFHVEHRVKAAHAAPAAHRPQQVTSMAESVSDACASSEDIGLDFSEPEPQLIASTRMHIGAPELHRSARSSIPLREVPTTALTDTTASAEASLDKFPEFTESDLDKWRGRAFLRALMSLSAAIVAFLWAAIDGIALIYFLGIIFALSAIKWLVLAGRPDRLRAWRDERARARENRSIKPILIRVLKWLLAIPIAIALLLGLLFSLSGGL
jgi:hypothetical protein